MEKDKIFFGDGGITDTRANQVANLAKLAYTDAEEYLSSLSFVNESVEVINGSVSKEVSLGIPNFDGIEELIEKIGNLKSLCAWLREAIAAHQRIINEKSVLTIVDYAREKSIELPLKPIRGTILTEEDVVSTFDVKKRNRYYSLEAHAATIGQIIHKGGSFDKARKSYYNALSKPHTTCGSGNDMIIYTFKPSVESSDIENIFYRLQNKHNEYQNELNQIKYEIQSKIMNSTIESNKKYEEEESKYMEEYQKVYNKFLSWKTEEQKEAVNLKIIIPNSLKDIFDEVSSKGKVEIIK